MKKQFCLFVNFFLISSVLFGQQQLELSNLPNNAPTNYQHNFILPVASDLFLKNGYQLTGNQAALNNAEDFQVYYESDTLESNDNHLMITDDPILMAGKLVHLQEGFHLANGDGIFTATIEKILADYDTETDGLQPVEEYNPDFRFRYFMSIFGPRLIFRNGVYRYDFHKGSDIIDLERPDDAIPFEDLPDLQCMCDGEVVEFVKLDDPADITNPNGVGRKTGIHCSGNIVTEPPLGDNSLIIENTGEGQYLVVKCNEQYPVELGFSNRDIYIAYRHLHDFAEDFTIGDPIKKGDLIGKMGQSGITSNYHLHLSALRRACLDNPSVRWKNVHPMRLFNPDCNPHLLRKLTIDDSFDNASSPRRYQEFNPEIHFLNYDTITTGSDPVIRIAVPYYQAHIDKIIIRDKNNNPPTNEWVFDFLTRSEEPESIRDTPHWDMNNDGVEDTVFIHHFNRGTSASFLFGLHEDESHYDGHPGRNWPITFENLFRIPAYVIDLKIVDFMGNKDSLEVEVFDIWGNGIKGIVTVNQAFQSTHSTEQTQVKLTNRTLKNDEFEVQIVPNPTTAHQVQIHLKLSEPATNVELQVINELGQVVRQQTINPHQQQEVLQTMHLTAFEKGVYVFQFKMGNQIVSKKVIVH